MYGIVPYVHSHEAITENSFWFLRHVINGGLRISLVPELFSLSLVLGADGQDTRCNRLSVAITNNYCRLESSECVNEGSILAKNSLFCIYHQVSLKATYLGVKSN